MFTEIKHRTYWVLAFGLAKAMPRRVLNDLTGLNIGRLSTTDQLRMRTVPEITVEDLTKAMNAER